MKKIKLRSLPIYQYFYLNILIIVFKFMNFSFDNDFWFTINQGRYVIENGFPIKAINSIHDIDFLYQSWGSGTLFYLVYNYLGKYGIILLLFIVSLLTSYFFYKLCFLLSKKKKLSLIVTAIVMILYEIIFMTTRPHIFTVLNLVLMFYLLESYIQKNNKKNLYFLPLIALLQVNMHGIYLILLMIIIFPYLINAFRFKVFQIESLGYNKKPLIITYFFMLLVSFINPYGYKTVIYGFLSYSSNSLFNNTIVELQAPNFHYLYGKIFIIIIILMYVIYSRNLKRIPLRNHLLLLGTSYLGLDANKSFYLFMFSSFFILPSIFFNNLKTIDKPYSKIYHYTHLTLTLIIVFLVIYNMKIETIPKNSVVFDYLDSVVKNKEDVKIYTNYQDGSYAEYRGYYCYMDPRGEIFLKSNSHKEDIYEEYQNLLSLKLNYKEFIDKYKFDYILVNYGEKLYYLMNLDSHNYQIAFEKDDLILYERSDLNE